MRKILYIIVLLLASCRYAEFEREPLASVELWGVTTSIDHLQEVALPIAQSTVVEGVVVANDSTGNFYKQIIVVDRAQRAALSVGIAYYDSYSQFAENQVVAIQLRGLVLKRVDGLLTAGYPPLSADTIPSAISTPALVARHVQRQGGKIILPSIARRFDELTLRDVGLPYLFTEVYMESPIGSYAGERKIRRVPQDTVATLYTSPYATFANDAVARSVFDMRAVVGSYKNRVQLKLLQVIEN